MARKKTEAPENHERWLVSYADFITLLFAFFVVMFASSQTDKGKAAQVSESVRKALEEGHLAPVVAAVLGGTVGDKGKGNAMMRGPGGTQAKNLPAAAPDLAASLEVLSRTLKDDIATGKLQMHLEARGLVISLREAAFFPSGADVIAEDRYSSIEKIADAIRPLPNAVRLEGHTDSIPIHNARFRSNWDLSAARGIAMLQLLTERYKIPDQRLAVVGFAETSPIDTNESAEGRARNRRVDVVVLNEKGAQAEPPAAATPVRPAPAAPAPGAAAPQHRAGLPQSTG